MSSVIPGTVCCLLCRGLVIYKGGDSTRFRAHLNNEHGAFFDVDYLLASSLMDAEQKAEVASAVQVKDISSKELLPPHSAPDVSQQAGNEKQFVCGLCSTHFVAKTAYIQHITKGCKKEAMKILQNAKYDQVPFMTKVDIGNLDVQQESIKEETVDHGEAQEDASRYEVIEAMKKNDDLSDEEFLREIQADRTDSRRDTNYDLDLEKRKFINGEREFSISGVDQFSRGDSAQVREGDDGQFSGDGRYLNQSDNLFSLGKEFEVEPEVSVKSNDDSKGISELKKNVPCKFCSKMFKTYQLLAKHVMRKHNSDQPFMDVSPSIPSMMMDSDNGIGQDVPNESVRMEVDTSGVREMDGSGIIPDVGKPVKEFVCSYHPCTKSFSSKQSLAVHERKQHDRPLMKKGRRSKKEILASNTDVSPTPDDYPQIPVPELELGSSFQEKLPSDSNYPRFPDLSDMPIVPPVRNFKREEINDEATLEESEPVAHSGSFFTDTSLGFDDGPNPPPEEDNVSQVDTSADLADFDDKHEDSLEQKPAIDISKSNFFLKYPNVIADARGKSVNLFDEEAVALPKGWRMRSIEVNSKTGGGVSTIKHYLSPGMKVLKTGVSVVEYLRLEGILETEKIVEIATKLNVSEKKLRNLYSTS